MPFSFATYTYVLLYKAGKAFIKGTKAAAVALREFLSSKMPPPAFAGINGTAFSIAIPSAEAAAQAGAVAGAVPTVLAMIGDFLFNYSSFKNDWNRLQEDIKQAEEAGGEAEEKYTGGRTEEELQQLAEDPAHAGSTRPIDVAKGQHEAEIGLNLEEKGLLDNIIRDPTGSAEFIEGGGTGQAWDIKSFNSYFKPNQGGFSLENAMNTINNSLAEGENVIIDTTNMSSEHISQLMEEIIAEGLQDRILWWEP